MNLILIFFTKIILFQIILNEEIEGRIRLDLEGKYIIETSNFSSEHLYIATAYYNPLLNEKGWDTLSLTTNKIFSDEIQAESAGRLEGSLTKNRIYNHYLNAKSSNGNLTDKDKKFFIEQEKFVVQMKNEFPDNIYFYNAYLILL